MNRITLFALFILSVSFEDALAFKKRDQRECGEINPEMGRWFQARSKKEAPLNRIIGPLKDQKAGWCFAFAAADMLSHASNVEISGAHVAKNYYASFMGKIKAIVLGRHESGTTLEALEKSLDVPLCDEKSYPSSKFIDYEKVKKTQCNSAVTELNGYKASYYGASGWYDGYTLFSKLDEILSDGRIAGIEYDQQQLIEDKTNKREQTIANHASSIVARYFDSKDSSCRYIIRNTYGKVCKKGNSKNTQCLNGYYSVTESQLNNMLVNVLSLTN